MVRGDPGVRHVPGPVSVAGVAMSEEDKMTRDEIDAYIKTKEPLDKAGAYAAQEKGGLFVEKIEGDFLNVVGLPIFKLTSELKKFNVKIL